MKKAFYPFGMALLVVSCQQQKPATQNATASTVPASATAAAIATEPAASAAFPTDSLTPAMRATLRQVDLSKLLLAPQPGFSAALDGFFGTNPQRLSLAILRAVRDSLQPEVIHVVGKARDRNQITGFTGEIRWNSLADYYDQNLLLSQGGDEFIQDTTSEAGLITNARAYAATATFHFVGRAPAAYTLTGQVALDFWLMDNGKIGAMHTPGEGIVLEKAATKGSGLVLQGNWQVLGANMNRPFEVSRDVFLLSPGLIKDFGIGDRGAQVNPKYAKLGWANYWENDEWWAESPKPKLSL